MYSMTLFTAAEGGGESEEGEGEVDKLESELLMLVIELEVGDTP